MINLKVRHLDKVKSRVEAVVQRVEDILDLKNCTDGIKIALDNEDYEIAAGHIHRYRTLDTNFLKNNANESVSIEASIEILENAERQMQKVARMKFESAYKEEDAQSIERFFKIFPLLGLHKEGLSKFVSFLSSQVASTTAQNLNVALEFLNRDEANAVIFSDTFVLLFEGLKFSFFISNISPCSSFTFRGMALFWSMTAKTLGNFLVSFDCCINILIFLLPVIRRLTRTKNPYQGADLVQAC